MVNFDGLASANHDQPATVVFVHAHPDDEAIFTGGTIAALSAVGIRPVVVIATSGELGEIPHGVGRESLRDLRRGEAERACSLLGAERLIFLDHVDSGVDDATARPAGAFVDVAVDVVAQQIAAILIEENASAVVGYDDHGIYEHPDHVHAHRATVLAAELAAVETTYFATVDREYLHFVESHLIHRADASIPSIRPIGSSTVEISTVVAVHQYLSRKQAAIAAHTSQIVDPFLGVQGSFADVYGYEWYLRNGPAGPIDHMISGAHPITAIA
ncbi:MAG: PIG-L family deacetylase [Actinobacteria bacterium]|nr:PIG-L family deacetylase [Actinomycetota bacterium]